MDMETAAIRFHVYPILHGLQYTVQQINDFCHNDLMFKNKTDQHFRALQVKSCLDRNAKTSAAAFHNIGHYGKGIFETEPSNTRRCSRWCACAPRKSGWCRESVAPQRQRYSENRSRIEIRQVQASTWSHQSRPPLFANTRLPALRRPLRRVHAKLRPAPVPWAHSLPPTLDPKAEQSNADELLCIMPSIHTATEHYWNVEGLSSHHRIEWCAREAFNQLVPKYRLMPVHGSKPYDSLLTTALQDDPSVPVKIQEKVCHQIGNAFRCRFYKTKHNKLVPYTHHDFDYMIAYLMGGWEWTNGQRQWVVNARTHLVGYWFIPINILLQRQARFPTKYFTLHASGDLYNMIGEEAHLRASWSKAYFTLI